MAEGLILAGRYRLTKQLGAGGMGSVWRAEDLKLGAEVAVKLIDSSLSASSEALARFRREACAAASIRSTYVVQILDYGIDDGIPFIAMELLKGESLAQRLASVGKLTPEQTAHLLGHVGRALALAHEHGIVHRDMKPENVFLVREGNEDVGKVLDFGIAHQAGGFGDASVVKTQTGAVLGTPYYMSPEQATGQAIDHQTDIWSFGVIAFECLVGRRTFDSESLGGLFHSICMAPLPTPSHVAVVPPNFDAWFARAVARDKSSRFQSAMQATEELRRVCGFATGRASAPSLTNHVGNAVVPATTAPNPLPMLGSTAEPSSQTIPGLPRKGALLPWLLAAGLLLLGVAAILGWRTLNSNEASVASKPLPTPEKSSLATAEPIVVAIPSATGDPAIVPVATATVPVATATVPVAAATVPASTASAPSVTRAKAPPVANKAPQPIVRTAVKPTTAPPPMRPTRNVAGF